MVHSIYFSFKLNASASRQGLHAQKPKVREKINISLHNNHNNNNNNVCLQILFCISDWLKGTLSKANEEQWWRG